jgi:hypothetical protein
MTEQLQRLRSGWCPRRVRVAGANCSEVRAFLERGSTVCWMLDLKESMQQFSCSIEKFARIESNLRGIAQEHVDSIPAEIAAPSCRAIVVSVGSSLGARYGEARRCAAELLAKPVARSSIESLLAELELELELERASVRVSLSGASFDIKAPAFGGAKSETARLRERSIEAVSYLAGKRMPAGLPASKVFRGRG